MKTLPEAFICSNREEWLQARRSGIGASDAAAILGHSRWRSPLDLFCDKIGLAKPESEIPEWIEWGNTLEPIIAEKFSERAGYYLDDPGRFTIQRSKSHPFLLVTLDRFIVGQRNGTDNDIIFAEEDRGICEIKNVAGFKEDEWEDELPIEYQIQMQHGFLVTGLKWGVFPVLFGGHKLEWFPVKRNDRFCAYLLEQETEFWRRIVENDPPLADGSNSSKEALKRLYPNDKGSTVTLPAELSALDIRLQGTKKAIKRLEAKEAELENLLKQQIGDNTFAVIPGHCKYSYKTSDRSGYTVEPTTYRQLRRLKTK
jgi:putative phage-type endonuclease